MNRVRELIEIKNISQKQVVIDVGIGQSTLSDYMTQRKDPKGEKLTKLAEYFGVDPMVIICKAPLPEEYAPKDWNEEYPTGVAFRQIANMTSREINTLMQRMRERETSNDGQLEARLIKEIQQLTPSQVQRVMDFVAGLKVSDQG